MCKNTNCRSACKPKEINTVQDFYEFADFIGPKIPLGSAITLVLPDSLVDEMEANLSLKEKLGFVFESAGAFQLNGIFYQLIPASKCLPFEEFTGENTTQF